MALDHQGPRRSVLGGGHNAIAEHLDEHTRALENFRAGDVAAVERVGAQMVRAIKDGHKIIAFGNGGSAAQAQHFAAELTGKFRRKRHAVPALAMTTDTSALTAISNDFGFEHVFARQCEALAQPGDIVVGITTSGRSRNVVAALEWCKAHGCVTIALTGAAGVAVEDVADHVVAIPSEDVAVTQELHLICLHILCQLVETAFEYASVLRPVLFVDRDGTLMRDTGFPSDTGDVELLPGAAEALMAFADDGFLLVVVTNQSGIARGHLSLADADRVNAELAAQLKAAGVDLDAILMCPHGAGDGCACRKPGTALLEWWLQNRNVDLTRSWMVGDRASDIDAGRALGIRCAYLDNGKAPKGSVIGADIVVRRLDELHSLVRSLREECHEE